MKTLKEYIALVEEGGVNGQTSGGSTDVSADDSTSPISGRNDRHIDLGDNKPFTGKKKPKQDATDKIT